MLIIKIIVCVIWVDLLYNVIYSELIGNIDISILPSEGVCIFFGDSKYFLADPSPD
jgi:hypothetical protein